MQEQQVKNSKNQSPKMVETGMLETESYRKEALLLARRAQPHILTAHEISQRNYGGGNLKTTNSTSRDLSQRSNESNRSYSKQYHALNSHVGNYNTTGQIGNSKMDRHIIQAPRCNPARIEQLAQPKKTVSPSPRRRTPEPILSLEPQPSLVKGYKIGQNPSRVGNGNVSYGYSREKHTQVGNKANRSHLVTQTMAE